MSGNYGTTGYGLDSNSSAAGMAAAKSNPYVAIAQFVVNRMSEPRSEAMDEAHKQQQANTGGKDINAESQSPFGVANTMGSQMMPGAEKMLPVNWKPMETGEGASTMQPTNIDSSAQPYQSTGMTNYLNYMKYRGGY